MVLFIVVVSAVAALVLYFVLKNYLNKQHLLKDGIQTSSKVVSITQTVAEVNRSGELPKPIYEIDFGIQAESESYRIVTVRKAFESWERIPQQGEEVILLIDPKNPDNAMVSPYQRRSD